jgi:hypothetical protein
MKKRQTVATNWFIRFFNFLANMGLIVRDDPPKVIDMTGRVWGESSVGLALSIRELQKDDPSHRTVISVVIRNAGPEPKRFTVGGWLSFYQVTILRPDGSPAEMSGYGRELTKPGRTSRSIKVSLDPAGAIETELPLGALYDMKRPGGYRVRISCRVPDGPVLESNEIVLFS